MVNVAAGEDGRLSIGAIGVDYSIPQLLRKRIEAAEIVGLEVELRLKNGLWDFGPLANLHGSADSEMPSDMPFRRITLRASTLHLDLDGRRLRIPVSGSVENTDQDTLAIDLAASFEDATFQLVGTFNTLTHDFKATAKGPGWQLSQLKVYETGLKDFFQAKTDRANIHVHCDATVDEPWLLLKGTPLSQWIAEQPIGKVELSTDGGLELRRAKGAPVSSWTWAATGLGLYVTLAPCDVKVFAGGTTGEGPEAGINGLAAMFDVLVDEADSKHVVARVASRSWIGFKSAEIRAGEDTVQVGLAKINFFDQKDRPLIAATFEGGCLISVDSTLTAGLTSHDPLAISAGDGLTVKLPAIDFLLTGTWGGKGGAVTGNLTINEFTVNLNRQFGNRLVVANVPRASLSLKSHRDFPANPGPPSPPTVDFDLRLDKTKAGQGPSASVAGADLAAAAIEAHGSVTLAGAAAPAIKARVSLLDASVQHKELGLAAAGITADVPLTWNVVATSEPGRFEAKLIELKGVVLPLLSGTLGVADTRADFTVDCEPLPGAKLRVEGSAAAGTGTRRPSARAYVSLPLFQITDEEAMGRLVPSLKGFLATGSFALDGYVRLTSDGLAPNLALTVLDGTFKSKAWEAEAEGVFATVRVDSVAPVLTPRKEFQVALVRKAKMGKLEVNDGFLAFRLEPKEVGGQPTGWTAYVQRGEWGWVGGRLYVEDFRFDPATKEQAVTVFARDLKLGALLALLPNQEASGVGSLNGQLPVTIGPWPNIHFGEGELRTAPGQSGWFKLKNTEVLGTVLESTDPRFQAENLYVEIKKRLVNAFKDFEYDELSVVFIKDGESYVARVNTKGRARTAERQEFGEVTLNFPNFDEILRGVILISRGVPKLK
jgi:hypothetical protein